MSETALCFRCDWAGAIRHRDCPRCGAPLYREARDPSSARPSSTVGGGTEPDRTEAGAPSPAGPADGPAPAPAPVPVAPARRNRPGAVLALIGGLTLLAVWVAARPRGLPAPPAAPPTLTGRIVYTPQGGDRLQILDLAEGTVERGPDLPGRLLSLTPASALGDSVVAVVERGPALMEAFLVDLSSAAPQPEPIASAVLLAVSPDGGHVLAGSPRGEDGSCAIVAVPVGRRGAREVGRVSRCRLALALEASRDEVFFTVVEAAGPTIHRLEPEGSAPILQGYILLAVSPAGELLAQPTEERRESVLVSETVLYRPGHGVVEIRRGTDGLDTAGTLAWSSDGRLVVVRGRVGADAGAWLIDSAAPSDPQIPAPVGTRTSSARISATFADESLIFLAIDGRLVVDSGDRTDPVAMPEDAAPPGGPMAWIP